MTTALQRARTAQALAGLRRAVALVRRPADVRRLRPQVRGLAEAVRRAKLGVEALNDVAEQAIRLERAAGAMLREVERRRGGSKARGAPLKHATAELGIHKRTAQKWEALAEISDTALETYFLDARSSGREITLTDLLRRCGPPKEREGLLLWTTWPLIHQAFEEERQEYLNDFAGWVMEPRASRRPRRWSGARPKATKKTQAANRNPRLAKQP